MSIFQEKVKVGSLDKVCATEKKGPVPLSWGSTNWKLCTEEVINWPSLPGENVQLQKEYYKKIRGYDVILYPSAMYYMHKCGACVHVCLCEYYVYII